MRFIEKSTSWFSSTVNKEFIESSRMFTIIIEGSVFNCHCTLKSLSLDRDEIQLDRSHCQWLSLASFKWEFYLRKYFTRQLDELDWKAFSFVLRWNRRTKASCSRAYRSTETGTIGFTIVDFMLTALMIAGQLLLDLSPVFCTQRNLYTKGQDFIFCGMNKRIIQF